MPRVSDQRKPYPWLCGNCAKRAVRPKHCRYPSTVRYEGVDHKVEIDLDIPTCGACGARAFSGRESEAIEAAFRDEIGLLHPATIRANREELRLTQRALAEQTGIAAETLSRLENGANFQSRTVDTLLRAYFAHPSLRAELGTGRKARDAMGRSVRYFSTLEATGTDSGTEELEAATVGAPPELLTLAVIQLIGQSRSRSTTPPHATRDVAIGALRSQTSTSAQEESWEVSHASSS